MRIKINGEDVERNQITISTYEASTEAGLLVVVVGIIVAIVWWMIWA